MKVFASGGDQFNLLSPSKRSNVFSLLNDGESSFEECILDWDFILYKSRNSSVDWCIKGINWPSPVHVFPWQKHGKAVISKVVSCGNIIYGLDQNSGTLYFVNVDELLSSNNSIVSKCESEEEYEVKFNMLDDDRKPKIVDISSSALECLAIDCEGGIYNVPNLLWRMENVNFRQIHSGYGFHLLLSDTGAVYSFGNSSRGELGQRTITPNIDSDSPPLPGRIEFFDDLPSIVVSLACGGWHSLALTSDGDIYSWGWNESGQLGHSVDKLSSITSDPFPIDLGSGDDPVVKIATSARHSVAALKSGKIYTWGFNKFGGLGVGDYDNRLVPTEVNLPCSLTANDCKLFKIQCGRWITLLIIPF